jgi:hypothetical protein
MAAQRAQGDFRVLWLGDPRVLPGTGWELGPGLAYALSENGLPDLTGLWPGSSPGPAGAIGNGVRLARTHRTVRLGRLLAPYAVRYVVVVDTLAPSIPGLQTPIDHPPPGDLVGALGTQIDLRQVISQGGFDVFMDEAALPERAVRSGPGTPSSAAAVTGVPPALTGWKPALPGPAGATGVTGRVPAGTVLAGVAPAARWQLTRPGGAVEHATTAFGYAATFPVTRPGTVTVAFAGSWAHGIEVGLQSAAWVVAAAALVGRRWWLDWWWRPLGRRGSRRRRRGAPPTSPLETPPAGTTSTGTADALRPTVSVSGDGFPATGTVGPGSDAR